MNPEKYRRMVVIVTAVLVLSACPLRRTGGQDSANGSSVQSPQDVRFVPEWNSFDLELESGFPQLLESKILSNAAIQRYPDELEPACTGAFRYTIHNGFELRRSALLDSIEQNGTAMPSEHYYTATEAVWNSKYRISGGPLVFRDRVLLITLEPAFIILDAEHLKLIETIPMDHAAFGTPVPGSDVFTLLHADNSSGLYAFNKAGLPSRAASDSGPDPVERFIQPQESALTRMESAFSRLRSIYEAESFIRIDIYGPRTRVDGEEAILYRYESGENPSPLRIYVDKSADRPYLLAVFDDEGQTLTTNIEYEAAKRIDFFPSADTVYYVAVAFLGDFPEKIEDASLVIAQRDI